MKRIKPDKFGHCVICHNNLLIEAVIDGKIQRRFKTEHSETMFLLNDGSKMRVAICTVCKPLVSEDKFIDIMDSVYEGWVKGIKESKTGYWDNKERKERYLKRYREKEIVTVADKVPPDILAKKLKEHKEKKEKV